MSNHNRYIRDTVRIPAEDNCMQFARDGDNLACFSSSTCSRDDSGLARQGGALRRCAREVQEGSTGEDTRSGNLRMHEVEAMA